MPDLHPQTYSIIFLEKISPDKGSILPVYYGVRTPPTALQILKVISIKALIIHTKPFLEDASAL